MCIHHLYTLIWYTWGLNRLPDSVKQNNAPLFQTHAWRQLPGEIKPRGEEETKTKTTNPSYLWAMSCERETLSSLSDRTSPHSPAGVAHIRVGGWHTDIPVDLAALASEPLPSARSEKHQRRRYVDGSGCGVLSGRAHTARACGYRRDQN